MEELEDLERYLREASILTWGEVVLEGGHPEKHRVLLAGGVQVIAKPALPGFDLVPSREAAGRQVAKLLGFVGLVAATVVRDVSRLSTGDPMPHSVQITWPDGRQWVTEVERLPDAEVWQAAVFDAVVSHADHAGNNWFGVPSPEHGTAHLRLVDTGNAFDLGGGAVNSTFYQHHLGDRLPDELHEAVEQFAEGDLSQVVDLLGEDEAQKVRQRAKKIAANEELTIT